MTRLVGLVLVLAVVIGASGGCSAAPAEKLAPAGEQPALNESPPAEPALPRAGQAGVGVRSDTTSAGTGSNAAATASWNRLVIRTANLSLVVRNVEEALGSIRDLAQANEGYVARSQSQYRGDHLMATITVQVPAQNLDRLIQQVRGLALKVESEQTNSQDVTEEFVDLSAQLRNLQAGEASLLKLMDRAERIEDVLSLQRELTNVRGQIERTQGRINYLQRRSDMSSLTVSLTPEEPGLSSDGAAWQPLRTIARAWRTSLQVVRDVADVAISVVVFSWWLWPFIGLVVWLLRRSRAGRTRPRAQTTAEPPVPPPTG